MAVFCDRARHLNSISVSAEEEPRTLSSTLTSNTSAVFGPKLLSGLHCVNFFVEPIFWYPFFVNERFSKYRSRFAVVIALSGSAGFNALLVLFTRSLLVNHSFLSFLLHFCFPLSNSCSFPVILLYLLLDLLNSRVPTHGGEGCSDRPYTPRRRSDTPSPETLKTRRL